MFMTRQACSWALSKRIVASCFSNHQLDAEPLLLSRAISKPKVLKANPALAARPRAAVAPVAASSGSVASKPEAASGPEAGREVGHSVWSCPGSLRSTRCWQAMQAAGNFSGAIAHCCESVGSLFY